MSAVGWLIAAAGLGLLYLALKPRDGAATTSGGSRDAGFLSGGIPNPNPGQPMPAPYNISPAPGVLPPNDIVVGIPKPGGGPLDNTFAGCLISGGTWDYSTGKCK